MRGNKYQNTINGNLLLSQLHCGIGGGSGGAGGVTNAMPGGTNKNY